MKQIKVKILANESLSAGRYIMRLASAYLAKNALPGQFVEIRCTEGVDPLLRRPLGIHKISPYGIEVMYEVVGRGTELLAQKKSGEELDLIGPLGNGFDLTLASDINILVAGGIGMAPIFALAANLSKKERKLTHVMMGAKTKSHIIGEKEFRSLGCRVKVSTDDGSKGDKGFVTELLKKFLVTFKPETYLPSMRSVMVYACGPIEMLKRVASITAEHGVKCQVSLEERMACGVGVCLGCPVKVKTQYAIHDTQYAIPNTQYAYKMVCKDGPVFDSGEIVWK